MDNLSMDFFDPIFVNSPYYYKIVTSLYAAVKSGEPNSHYVARLLGKLGGRNRNLAKHLASLDLNASKDAEFLAVEMRMEYSDSLAISISTCLASAERLFELGGAQQHVGFSFLN